MTALDVMRRLRQEPQEEARVKEQIEMRRDAVTRVSARYEAAPGGSSPSTDRMAQHAVKVEPLLNELKAIKERWRAEMEYCVKLTDKMESEVWRKILYNYYGKGWTLAAVADFLGYSEGYIRKQKSKMDAYLAGIIAVSF